MPTTAILKTIGNAGYLIQLNFPNGRWRVTATDRTGETWIVVADDQLAAAVLLGEKIGFDPIE